MGDVKQFLYAWCGKRKVTPCYEFSQTGSKHKPRFKCEVCIQHVIINPTYMYMYVICNNLRFIRAIYCTQIGHIVAK